MPSRIANRRLFMRRPSGVSYDAATTAWVSAVVGAGGTVSGPQQAFVDTLIKALKSHSSWALLDRLWLYASENATQAKIDLVALASHTVVGTPTFTANRGYQQAATSDYLDTGYQLSTGTNFTQNSASVSTYVQTSRAGSNNSVAFGCHDAASTGNITQIHPLFGPNTAYGANNTANTLDNSTNADAKGIYTVNRSAASGAGANDLYKAASSTPVATNTTASTTRPSLNMFVLSANLNGANSAGSVTGDRVAMFAIGGSLGNGTAIAQFQTDIQAYMTSVGA